MHENATSTRSQRPDPTSTTHKQYMLRGYRLVFRNRKMFCGYVLLMLKYSAIQDDKNTLNEFNKFIQTSTCMQVLQREYGGGKIFFP